MDIPLSGIAGTDYSQGIVTAEGTMDTRRLEQWIALLNSAGPVYVTATGSTTPRMLANRFADVVNVKNYGATGDGVTDDYAAIALAIATLTGTGGVVFFPRGNYLVSQPIVVDIANLVIAGDGGSGWHTTIDGPTRITATHTLGPVLRIRTYGCTVRDITLSASTGRTAAAAGSNYGLQIEGQDVAGASVARQSVLNVRITSQPSHGILFIGNCVSTYALEVDVDQCGGHAFVVNDGTITSRTNLDIRPGQIDLINCRASRCGGHSIAAGNPTTLGPGLPYRLQIINFETFFCASNASVRLEAYNAFIGGENIWIRNSAFSGRDLTSTFDEVGGIYGFGKFWDIEGCRFIDCLAYAVRVADKNSLIATTTEDMKFSRFYINNQYRAANYYDPAIFVEANCTSIAADINTTNTDVTNKPIAENAATWYEWKYKDLKRFNGRTISDTFSSNRSSLSLSNDKAAYIEFSAPVIGMLNLCGNVAAAKSAIACVRCGDASAYATALASVAGVAVTTGQLTGTTGVAGNLTISGDTATNRLYIENRTGGSRSYNFTLLGFAGYIVSVTNLP